MILRCYCFHVFVSYQAITVDCIPLISYCIISYLFIIFVDTDIRYSLLTILLMLLCRRWNYVLIRNNPTFGCTKQGILFSN